MTLILGLKTLEGVYLAADSIGSNGFTFSAQANPKLFKNGPFRIGYTSSFRMGQLLEHDFSPPARTEGQELLSYVVEAVGRGIRPCLSSGGFARNNSGEESGGTFLMTIEKRLFTVQDDYAVLEPREDYTAVGSGEYHALGALHATRDMSLSPLKRLRLAVEAAEANVITVRGPWWVMRPQDERAVLLSDVEGAAFS